MGNEVKKYKDIPIGHRMFVYHGSGNPELWIGDNSSEEHTSILASSNRELDNGTITGIISKISYGATVSSISSRGVGYKNPEQVIVYIASLEGSEDQQII